MAIHRPTRAEEVCEVRAAPYGGQRHIRSTGRGPKPLILIKEILCPDTQPWIGEFIQFRDARAGNSARLWSRRNAGIEKRWTPFDAGGRATSFPEIVPINFRSSAGAWGTGEVGT